jgi:RNA polymerase sigma-70 factor (ECF subfamily)
MGADQKAAVLAQIAVECRNMLLWRTRRVAACREEAEDIVQEALLKAMRGLARFRGDARMDTWVQAILRNQVREYLRSRNGLAGVSREFSGEEGEEYKSTEIADPSMDPEDWCVRMEMERRLYEEIEKLSAPCKSAIEECFLEGLSQQELAETLHVDAKTIKSRVFRGKRTLREAMREYAS